MAFSLELKKTSNQQNDFNRVKERVLTPQANQSANYQDKLKVKSRVGPSSSDLCSESRQDADGRILIQAKTSKSLQRKHSLKSSSAVDDELVKHMSNLPNYLLRTEREENIQEKALNVGVLDWSRLEKWKHKQKHIPDRGNNVASCSRHPSLEQTIGSSHFPNGIRSETPAERNSSIHPPKRFNSSARTASQFQEAGRVSMGNTRGRTRKPCAYSDMVHEREKRKHLDQKTAPAMACFSSNMRNNTVLLCPKRSAYVCDDEPNRNTEKLKGTDIKRKVADQIVLLQVEDVSLKSTNGTSLSSKAVNLQDSDIDVTHQHSRGEHNIVLLLPKQKIQNGIPDAFHSLPLRTSFDENLFETNSGSNLDVFSPGEILSSEFYSEIPHSCPLPSLDVNNAVQDVMLFSPVNDRTSSLKPSLVSSQSFPLSNEMPSLTSESKHSGTSELDSALTNSEAVNTSKTLDHEMADFGDRRSRNPSPNRRFSFSLGRMGRSFSFKESSTIPRLSSTYVTPKSGPMKSEAPAPFDGLNREKINGNNRARSSPLRRLIEPILKYKAANSPRCEEANLNSFSIWANGISQKEKHVASTVQALLQLTVKNGLPLYMFTVDNKNNILAATMRSLASSGKDESGQNCTFYSVNEIKRKNGGWMRGGSTEKLSSYVYNVVGQMKVSTSHFLDLGREKSSGMYTLKESVLFGVEVRTGNHESPKFKKDRELAAAVFKMPIQKVDHGRKHDDKMNHCGQCWEESRCICSNSREIGEADSVIVILPGGLHGSPSDGEPSPLIDRWKSGGSCDCGGWDVGCKLRVFSNPQKCVTDRFELFSQGGTLQDKPLFSMAPLKDGMYSIEFNSSISLLQAFFICISVTSCEKTSDLSRMSNITSESKALREPKFKSSDELRGKAPARYAPNPPLSPVGRV